MLSKETRIVLGCLATPFAAAATMFAAAAVADPWLNPGGVGPRFDQPAAMAIGVWFLALPVMAVAVPLVLWMARSGPVSLRAVLLVGAGLGVLPIVFSAAISFLYAALSTDPIPRPMTVTSPILMSSFGIVVGVCSALTFWAIALRTARRDREVPAFILPIADLSYDAVTLMKNRPPLR